MNAPLRQIELDENAQRGGDDGAEDDGGDVVGAGSSSMSKDLQSSTIGGRDAFAIALVQRFARAAFRV